MKSKTDRKIRFVLLVFVLMVLMWAVGVLFVGVTSAKCPPGECDFIPPAVGAKIGRDPVNPAGFGTVNNPRRLYIPWVFGPFDDGPDDDWRDDGDLVCPDPANPDFCYRGGGGK